METQRSAVDVGRGVARGEGATHAHIRLTQRVLTQESWGLTIAFLYTLYYHCQRHRATRNTRD